MSLYSSKVVAKQEVSADLIPCEGYDVNNDSYRVSLPDSGLCRDSFYIEKLLSPSETQHLINCVEKAGLDFWDPNSVETDSFRRAYTLEVSHERLASIIWSRVKDLVVPVVDISPEDTQRHEIDIEGNWKAVGINPKMLFSRYLEGGHFAPHTDGCTIVDINERSLFSCVVYLNDCEQGGQTRLYSNEQIDYALEKDSEGRLTGRSEFVIHEVSPVNGRMLAFYHTQMHEGVPASCKYIIRTDVMYRRETPICTEPNDIEAFDLYMQAQHLAEYGENERAVVLFRKAFKMSPNLSKLYRMG